MTRRLALAALAAGALGGCAVKEQPPADTLAADTPAAAVTPAPDTPAADTGARPDTAGRADSARTRDTTVSAARREPAPGRGPTPPVYGRDSVIQRPPRMLPPRDTVRPPR